MFNFLFHLSDVSVFTLLSILSIIISIIAIFLVRKHIPSEIRYQDNAAIGITSSLISIIYGVLAGLMALYEINNITFSSDVVQREANAVANLYRDSHWLNEGATKTDFQAMLNRYLSVVIDKDWEKMQKEEPVSSEGEQIIDKLHILLGQLSITTKRDEIMINNMLSEIKQLYNAREQRIKMSQASLSPEIWVVILIGSFLTIGINFLFGMNIYLHVITVGAVALMASAMIFLLITLDRPFQGEFEVGPGALKAVQYYIDHREV